MKKLLIISSTPFFGGAERFIVSTLSQLESFYEIYYFVKDQKTVKMLGLNSVLEINSDLKFFNSLKSYIKKINPDILLFNGSSIAYTLPLFKKYKRVYYRHTTNLYAPKSRRWLFKWMMNCIYRCADLTIHVSKYSLNEQKIGKGICIHNGINIPPKITKTISSRGPIKVLFCSRLEKAKGIKEIVKAFNSISPEKACLTIIGNGNCENWVKENAKDHIKYLGFQKDVSKFYETSDVLILMSDFENFPISIIEAMSHGLPIITTGVGGISEMVKDGYNGKIIDSDPKIIVETIGMLCQNRELLKTMGENSYNFCLNNLNIDNKTEEIHKALDLVFKQ